MATRNKKNGHDVIDSFPSRVCYVFVTYVFSFFTWAHRSRTCFTSRAGRAARLTENGRRRHHRYYTATETGRAPDRASAARTM